MTTNYDTAMARQARKQSGTDTRSVVCNRIINAYIRCGRINKSDRAEKSLNDYAGNKVGYVNKLNDAFVGYATFSLQGTNVSHVKNKRSLEKWEIIGKKRQR